jgi:hypothetical protein
MIVIMMEVLHAKLLDFRFQKQDFCCRVILGRRLRLTGRSGLGYSY